MSVFLKNRIFAEFMEYCPLGHDNFQDFLFESPKFPLCREVATEQEPDSQVKGIGVGEAAHRELCVNLEAE